MSLSEPRDRLNMLLAPDAALNGIDYVEIVAGDASQLIVHFINTVTPDQNLAATITGGDSIPTVAVGAIEASDWSTDDDKRPLLTLNLPDGPGDFSEYTLTLAAASAGADDLLDRYFDHANFSFKALCPADFDCLPPPHLCPPDATPPPAIDYTAKDFGSFVRALGAFSAQNYPNWQERAEADFGVVVMEALAALADEFSYYQDRVAAEAAITTATQRRSLTSLARLVDYEPTPAQSATTLLLCTVASASHGIPAGLRVSATGPDGSLIPFEIGTGLNDTKTYAVSRHRNFPIHAYWWNDSDRCLNAGATQLWVKGADHGFAAGMQVLVQTDLPGDSIRQIVTLTSVETAFDRIFLTKGKPTHVTLLIWGPSDALTQDRNLVHTRVGGNLLPATQGLRVTESFAIPPAPAAIPLAIIRRGPNATDAETNPIYRRPLASAPIAWLPPPPSIATSPLLAANALAPEFALQQTAPSPRLWPFVNNLLDASATEAACTIDPTAWRVIGTDSTNTPIYDYDGDAGESIRFGDGVFGLRPDPGDIFSVRYRVGQGSAGNVAPDAINIVDPAWASLLTGARNPFAATGGADAESPQHIRNIAPWQFQATQFRDVRPADYVASAEQLPWVYRAGCAFRWTGSWLSVFTVADPEGTDVISPKQHLQLVDLLNRRRLAGYESFAPNPDYVSLDLVAEICVAATAIGPDIEAAVLTALSASATNTSAFFFADRFTFGTPLYRSALEAAIQAVPGVNGVLSITYRERGVTTNWRNLPDVFPLAPNRILRIENNPDYPEHGTLKVIAEGGR